MDVTTKKYTLPELKMGMRVRMSELQNILDVHMILIDTKIISNDDLIGTLVYAGDGKDENCDKWIKQTKPITPIYFSREEFEDGVEYDE